MGLSILDQVAPHTRFHVGLDYVSPYTGVHIQDVQIVNREGRSVYSQCLYDGKSAGRPLYEPRFAEHLDYFSDLCERHVRTTPCEHDKALRNA